MGRRSYGQFCGVAAALTMIGERWALLIVRDLMVGPRRFTDLLNGLPAIPTNVLSSRLKELEGHGVIRRRVLPLPEKGVAYELTEYGSELEEAVLALGRWGARSLTVPAEDEIVTTDSMIMALRTTFRPGDATGVRCGFQLNIGDVTVHAQVDDGRLRAAAGHLPDADLVIETGPQIRALMAGERTPEQALDDGTVHVQGEPGLLQLFTRLFAIDARLPAAA
ncbi:winged helix-turn-helix transcriptional regulator [Dactylosporangium sp. CA-152071]|uniref:winged helix-turn-helix transcriptional regulator n=1 Tax=Dactylosporangium sp. CA-152071 TaxID=3239933 RepID=UPI003D8CE7E1